jgi:hypothetical protein
MNDSNKSSEEWLARENSQGHEERLARLNWLVSNTPDAEFWTFPGCLISKYLFEESRYCFVYGQFLAVIVLGMSYIEHTLAAMFYTVGRSDLERANISRLLGEAVTAGWISQDEYDHLNKAREIRNPVTHFRSPLRDDTIECRAMTQDELPYIVIEEDARYIMAIALHLLNKM